MQFTITQAGLLAAQNAQAGGPKITITSFKVGSAYNYVPNIGDVALRGAVLHTQLVNGYSVLSANEVEYTLILNEEVGNFNFGEVGLFLEDGTLFSIGSLDALQPKTKSGQTDSGNIISIDARLVMSQLAANISFPINAMPNARMLETPTVDMLKPPSVSDTNAYLTMSKDSGGSSIPAFKSGDFDWGFPSFSRVLTALVTANGKGYTNATVVFTGGNPTRPAVAQATLVNGAVQALTLTDAGAGYTSAPTITITGDGVGAGAVATIAQGVTALTIVNGGAGYTSAPTVLISGGGGTGATAVAQITNGVVTGLVITNPGSGYTSNPTVTLSGGGGGAATATAAISGVVNSVRVLTNSTQSMLCAELSDLAAAPIAGKYILEFLSGPLAGYCRMVTASTPFSISWALNSPTGSAPLAGAQFALWQSNASILGADRNTQPPPYNVNAAYSAGKVVSYQQQLWRCNTDTPSGSFNTAHWTRILGTGAAANLQNGLGDVTVGTVLTPGSFGIGGNSLIAADLNTIEVGGMYSIEGATLSVPAMTPAILAGSQVLHMSYTHGAARGETQLLMDRGTDRMMFRRCINNVWSTWMTLANTVSPALTGTPTAPTAAAGTNTTQLATTAFVAALGALKANLDSPSLTGTPLAPTAGQGTNSTQIATTAFVQAAIAQLIASAPGALDTLKELADALGNDPNFATSMTNSLALKAPLASPNFTGIPLAPTAAAGTSTTQLATTAFVQAAVNGLASVSIAGNGTATLTAAQYGAAIIVLTGALTGNKTVVLPTAAGIWQIDNNTTGAFTVTVKTANGTGVVVTQGANSCVFCDGTNILLQQTDFISPVLTGIPLAPTAAAGTNTTQIATTAFVKAAVDAFGTITQSAYDTTPGRLLKVGDYGLGTTDMQDLVSGTDLNTVYTSGFYQTGPSNLNAPASVNAGQMIVMTNAGNYCTQILFPQSTSRMFVRSSNAGTWTDWYEAWTTRNLVKSATQYDNVVGSVMKNGDFGLGCGGNTLSQLVTDCNDPYLTGFYRIGAGCVNAPAGFAQGATLIHSAWNNGTFQQIMVYGSRMWQRQMAGIGVWSAWTESWTSANLTRTTSQYDTTAGSVMRVADFGVGARGLGIVANFDDPTLPNGLWSVASSSTDSAGVRPTGFLWGILRVEGRSNVAGSQGRIVQTMYDTDGTYGATSYRQFQRRWNGVGSAWTPWVEVWTSETLFKTTSATDTTAGAMTKVGDYGWGINSGNAGISYLGSNYDLNGALVSGSYGQSQNANATTALNYPVAKAGTLLVQTGGGQITTQQYQEYDTGNIWTRARYNSTWTPWALQVAVGYNNFGLSSQPAVTFASDVEWAKPNGWCGFVNVGASKTAGCTVPTTTAGGAISFAMYMMVARRDTNGGYYSLLADYASGRIFCGFSQTSAGPPTWRELFGQSSVTAFAQSLLDDSSAAEAQDTLGIPTLITQNTRRYRTIGGGISANTTLTAANMGQWINVTGAGGITVTLPSADTGITGTIVITNRSSSSVTIATGGGNIWSTVASATITLNRYEVVELCANSISAGGWWITSRGRVEESASTVSPAFLGTPTVPTASTPAAGTQIANLDYVRAWARKYIDSGIGISADFTLTQAHAGYWMQFNAAGITVTLPTASTTANGSTFVLRNGSNAPGTIACPANTNIVAGMGQSLTSMTLNISEVVELTASGSSFYVTNRSSTDSPLEAMNRLNPHGSQAFTASGSWVCPAGVTEITVAACGGGGGGAGGSGASDSGSGGGSGGGCGQFTLLAKFAVTPGETLNVVIGAGGSAGSAGAVVPAGTFASSAGNGGGGGNGGATTLRRASPNTLLVQMLGGLGGAGGTSVSGAGGISGGAGSTNGGDAQAQFKGGNGGAGGSCPFGTGGGGGRAANGAGSGGGSTIGWGSGGGGGGAAYSNSDARQNNQIGGPGSAGQPGLLIIYW